MAITIVPNTTFGLLLNFQITMDTMMTVIKRIKITIVFIIKPPYKKDWGITAPIHQ